MFKSKSAGSIFATVAAALLLLSAPCNAKPQATRLGIYNNTLIPLTTTVSGTNNSDWEGNQPDDNFNPRTIGPLAGSVQPEEPSSRASSALFTMTIAFQNGDVVTFTADQKNAWNLHPYEARKLDLSGPQAENYVAFMVTQADETLAISITDRQDPTKWMAQVSDAMLLSRLTIPGTHDSASLFENAFSLGFAKTQDIDLPAQLNLGVRFFDIRLNKDLDVYHGPVFQHLNFSQVVNICTTFLQANPSETILMLINASDPKDNSKDPDKFARAIYNATNAGTGPWAVGNKVPTLGAVRGKIQLLRRYPAGSTPPIGIDVTDWPDDTRYDTRTNSDGVNYAIQDHWRCCGTPAGRTDKRNEISAQYNRALVTANILPATVFFNFTSTNRVPVIGPRGNAAYFNPFTLGLFVTGPNRKRAGIFAMDFIEWEQTKISPDENDQQALIQQIISYNLLGGGSGDSIDPSSN